MYRSTSCSYNGLNGSDVDGVVDYDDFADDRVPLCDGGYKRSSTSFRVRNFYNASKRYGSKILGWVTHWCHHATDGGEPRQAIPPFACKLWTPRELEVAKAIERDFLRSTDGKRRYGIKNISIDGRTVELTIGGGVFYSSIDMLQSELFRRNCLSIINFRFSRSGNEVLVERTSDKSFNYVVTKGSVAIAIYRDKKPGLHDKKGIYPKVSAGDDGAVRVTNMEVVKERYQRDTLSGINISINGVSLSDLLRSANWKWDSEKKTYVQYAPNKTPSTTLWTPRELKVAKAIERDLLYSTDGKHRDGIKNISIDGRSVELTIIGGFFCNPIDMLQSELFARRCLSIINFRFPSSGSEVSVERTSDKSFNYVVTKGSVAIYRYKQPGLHDKKGIYPNVTAGDDGAVRVTNMEVVKERYQRDTLCGINISINGVSLSDLLRSANWKWDSEKKTHVQYVPNKTPSTTLSVSECTKSRGGGIQLL